MNIKLLSFGCCCLVLSPICSAKHDWFVKPYVGLSQMSDMTLVAQNVESQTGNSDIQLDGGFVSGLGVGYVIHNNLAIELAWEYRSNESTTALPSNNSLYEGNIASNLFFLNTYYVFNTPSSWQPYIGAGVSWAQEVDIDLEEQGSERSYSSDGDTGYQVFAGMLFKVDDAWSWQGEIRYGQMKDITLNAESGTGEFNNLDYDTLTLQLSAVYHF
ncbi:hypothetical protein N473_15280 [Pseudoalteromonas luteoviolacea CPMOR-1]|uniref:Outer membrane protein beta-barrel domain-containing protein n=1 Tax=Pseudoalteromonas luteoviolacea CPMOR-1 TaxID=1365248 RepID=A0A167LCX3_9GAMM|nr:porin family protein [Pseudoalteromonas luteoviolacea]KZN64308.1 hypothetical protein N473_15280 [Pseudoalteromonas luteoviolacea CPMOR-1]